jgi:tRNA pseudouridine55 synthase
MSPRRRVDGILLLDKPSGIGSTRALARARVLFGADKAGHGGTLDPMASGLLPILFGEATKFAKDSLEAGKTYLASLTLGISTDTADAEGKVIQARPVCVSRESLADTCTAFVGQISQVPPMHSALKRDGRPLYDYARAGIVIDREPRQVTVDSIELIDLDCSLANPVATIRVRCSKGTYIRTLAADIGERLGCGAHLSMLRRESVGTLSIDRTFTPARLESMTSEEREQALLPLDTLVQTLPRMDLDPVAASRFLHGQRLPVSSLNPLSGVIDSSLPQGRVRVYADSRLIGLADCDQYVLAPSRLIHRAPAEEQLLLPARQTEYTE